jgi:hypothetical protein
MSGKVKSPSLVNTSVENDQETPPELMYRAPGREDHQNIVEIFDEIMNRLNNIEQTLSNIQNSN